MLLAALLAAMSAVVPAGAPTVREHGPIPIYQPVLMAPTAVAGSGLRPLVRAKLFIDTNGRVTRVDVGAVEPSSPLDEAFRTAARAGLSVWRFAAAEKDGHAISSETSVALQFTSSEAADGGDPFATSILDPSSDKNAESLRYEDRARILSMELTARRMFADAFAAKAEALLKKDRRVTAADDGFEVVTDFGGPKQANAVLQNVRATYAALLKLVGERIPPLPLEERIRIYVFETKAQYQALVERTAPFEGSAGIYSSSGVLAFHAEQPTVGLLLATMLHETTHAFVDRHVVRRGVQLPRWLDEGLAEYVGESDIKDGKLVPGGHAKRREIGHANTAIVFWQSPSKLRAQEAKSAQSQKRALTLGEIVSAGPEAFYGKDVDLYYAQGWLAVHFLRHGRPEWTDSAFPRFLLYAAEGYPAGQALRAAYGVDARDLETAYQRYVKSF